MKENLLSVIIGSFASVLTDVFSLELAEHLLYSVASFAAIGLIKLVIKKVRK